MTVCDVATFDFISQWFDVRSKTKKKQKLNYIEQNANNTIESSEVQI